MNEHMNQRIFKEGDCQYYKLKQLQILKGLQWSTGHVETHHPVDPQLQNWGSSWR